MLLKKKGSLLTLIREHGEAPVRNESALFHRLRNVLRSKGEDVIKKLMWKDGHMVSDDVYYVRSRNVDMEGSYGIYDPQYQVRDISTEYENEGSVQLAIISLGTWGPIISSMLEGPFEWWPSR